MHGALRRLAFLGRGIVRAPFFHRPAAFPKNGFDFAWRAAVKLERLRSFLDWSSTFIGARPRPCPPCPPGGGADWNAKALSAHRNRNTTATLRILLIDLLSFDSFDSLRASVLSTRCTFVKMSSH